MKYLGSLESLKWFYHKDAYIGTVVRESRVQIVTGYNRGLYKNETIRSRVCMDLV